MGPGTRQFGTSCVKACWSCSKNSKRPSIDWDTGREGKKGREEGEGKEGKGREEGEEGKGGKVSDHSVWVQRVQCGNNTMTSCKE